MSQIIKYLIFIGVLAAASYAAANFDLGSVVGTKATKNAPKQKGFRDPYISKKPTSLLSGLPGQAAIDYSPVHNLTAAAADDVIMVWHLPDANPLHEIDGGEGFQALSLRFIPATSLVAAGGMKIDYSGSIRFFDAATGNQRLQIDEPEPILFLDPHPGGRYLLATGETYIKVLDMKDGNTVAILQKSNPASRGYYYGNGQYLLQSDSLSLFDLNKRSMSGTLDSVKPLLFKKGLDGKTFAWVSAEGVTVVTSADGRKTFFPLDTKSVTAFDIEPNGAWGLFLIDAQKIAVIDLAGGKVIKTINLNSSVSDVNISADGSSVYVQYSPGGIAVFDIGHRNKLKNMQFHLSKMFDSVRSKLVQAAKPEPK
ncbi:MAG: WD40 repeat domain-containing protein [Deltaproteobacteria bacterium]